MKGIVLEDIYEQYRDTGWTILDELIDNDMYMRALCGEEL